MKKEIITIVGVPGSGKSSTADLVAARLDFQRFSPGDFMRKMALETELSLNELGKKAEEDGGEIDRKIDEETRKIGKKEKIVLRGKTQRWSNKVPAPIDALAPPGGQRAEIFEPIDLA